jgi:hypothetical protein
MHRKFFCQTASLGLSEEQQQMQNVALRFAKEEMSPNMERWDEEVSPS